MKRFIEMGQIVAPHGIKGLMKVNPFCTDVSALKKYAPFYNKDGQKINLEVKNALGRQILVHVDGVEDRNEAEKWRGVRLFVERDVLPQLKTDEYYICDLIGLTALDEKGEKTGIISNVLNYGAGDILEIETNQGSKILVSMTKQNVPNINLEEKYLTLIVPEEVEGDKR